jgi:hypothetical protein
MLLTLLLLSSDIAQRDIAEAAEDRDAFEIFNSKSPNEYDDEIDRDLLVEEVLQDTPARDVGVREAWASRSGWGRKEDLSFFHFSFLSHVR